MRLGRTRSADTAGTLRGGADDSRLQVRQCGHGWPPVFGMTFGDDRRRRGPHRGAAGNEGASRTARPNHQVRGCTHTCLSMVVRLESSEYVLRDRTMSQLRLDPLTGRWVVISADRAERPFAFVPRSMPVEADPNRACPFCPGNEEATPPALEAFGPSGRDRKNVVE